jgi:5-formyltetrahydrofolate cyclo-ligase
MPTDPDDESEPLGFASPPCYLHEFASEGVAQTPPPEGVAQWRKTTRARLIAARQAEPAEQRATHTALIVQQLESLFAPAGGAIVGAFWPIRAEPDFRPWMRELIERGVRVALPVIVSKDAPLLFREWRPDATLKRGVWGIPEPADGETLKPTLLLAPLVGFDDGCYRLGYGGGYFDRTLAALAQRPLCIGVGSPAGHMATIYPQPFDQPMDWIVTGQQPARQRPR